jgi:hypothetical protein
MTDSPITDHVEGKQMLSMLSKKAQWAFFAAVVIFTLAVAGSLAAILIN